MSVVLEKNGERITLTNAIQIAAYQASGWKEVSAKKPNGKSEEGSQKPARANSGGRK